MFFLSRLFLFLPILLFSDVTLKEEYCFEKDVVTLQDFVKEANSTEEFFNFPNNVTKYQIQSGKIIQALSKIDINATSPYSIIELRKNCDVLFPKEFISDKLKSLFKETYKLLDITSIKIMPKNELQFDINQKYIKDVIISDTALKNDKGSFYVVYEKNRERRIYFDFEIRATLTLLRVKKDMEKGDVVTNEDIEYENVIFDRISTFPIDKNDLESNMLTRYLKAGDIIYKRDITKITAIKKNSTVKALIKDGGVELFFDVTALDDGDIGDTIVVRQHNGKQYDAIITAKNRVIIK